MPRRLFVEVLACALALAVGAAGARYGMPAQVVHDRWDHDVVRLTETQHVTNNITNVTNVEQKGQKDTSKVVKPDGTTVETSRVVWDNTAQSKTDQKLTLDLARTTLTDHTSTEHTVTTNAGPALTIGIGAGGSLGFAPLHIAPSVAAFGVYRVGEVFKVPISIWGIVALQPPTFAPNAAFVGVAVSL